MYRAQNVQFQTEGHFKSLDFENNCLLQSFFKIDRNYLSGLLEKCENGITMKIEIHIMIKHVRNQKIL